MTSTTQSIEHNQIASQKSLVMWKVISLHSSRW